MKWAREACPKLVLGDTGTVLDNDTPLFQHRRKTGAWLTRRPPKILMHERRRSNLESFCSLGLVAICSSSYWWTGGEGWFLPRSCTKENGPETEMNSTVVSSRTSGAKPWTSGRTCALACLFWWRRDGSERACMACKFFVHFIQVHLARVCRVQTLWIKLKSTSVMLQFQMSDALQLLAPDRSAPLSQHTSRRCERGSIGNWRGTGFTLCTVR
jgi:hypothetical protein